MDTGDTWVADIPRKEEMEKLITSKDLSDVGEAISRYIRLHPRKLVTIQFSDPALESFHKLSEEQKAKLIEYFKVAGWEITSSDISLVCKLI